MTADLRMREIIPAEKIESFWSKYETQFDNEAHFEGIKRQVKSDFIKQITLEAFRRTKEQFYPRTDFFFSDPDTFNLEFGLAYHKYFNSVFREAKNGKFEVDEHGKRILSAIPSVGIEQIVESLDQSVNSFNSSYIAERSFLDAAKSGDYNRARKILDGLKAIRGWDIEQPVTQQTIQLYNWEYDLAVHTGNIDAYVKMVNLSKRKENATSEDGTIYKPILKKTLQTLVDRALIDTLEIEGDPQTIRSGGESIRDLYSERFFSELTEAIVSSSDEFTKSSFLDLVKKTATNVGKIVSQFYPLPIEVRVRYKPGI